MPYKPNDEGGKRAVDTPSSAVGLELQTSQTLTRRDSLRALLFEIGRAHV
jgi:hypothetical protein